MKIVFLGTGSMVPSKERNHTSILLNYNEENILIDCGEGTQRQLRHAGISATKITRLLITHWHGDHILGIPGLIQTLGASNYNKTLYIYGPLGTKKYLHGLFSSFINNIGIKIEVKEINSGRVLETERFYFEAKPMNHNCLCLGYSFIEKDKRNINVNYIKKFGLKQHPILKELQNGKDILWNGKKIKASKALKITKGKKITFILDTYLTNNAVKLAKNSDLLICESTLADDLKENAKEYKHLTNKMAAGIAKKAKASRLILTHFSQRYTNVKDLEKEAKQVFKNTLCAYDFMVVNI